MKNLCLILSIICALTCTYAQNDSNIVHREKESATYFTWQKGVFWGANIGSNTVHAIENIATFEIVRGDSLDWHTWQDIDRYATIGLGVAITFDALRKDTWWKSCLVALSDGLVWSYTHTILHKGIINSYYNRPFWEEKFNSNYDYAGHWFYSPEGKIIMWALAVGINVALEYLLD